MSGSVNKVFLIGNLGCDPVPFAFESGTNKTNFTLATSERWGDTPEESRTEWHWIVCWGKLAAVCAQHLQKGRKVCVVGRIQSRKYQGDQGEKTAFEIIAQDVVFLDSKGGVDAQASAATVDPAPAPATTTAKLEAIDYESEIPPF